jgi:hypothetical protein
MTNCTFFWGKVELCFKTFIMETKERAAIKAAIMQSLSEEVDNWLDKEPRLTSGYDYETEFLKTTRTINMIILKKSLGEQPRSRNAKKKSTPALGK